MPHLVLTEPADLKNFAIDFIVMEASSTDKSIHLYLGAYLLIFFFIFFLRQ